VQTINYSALAPARKHKVYAKQGTPSPLKLASNFIIITAAIAVILFVFASPLALPAVIVLGLSLVGTVFILIPRMKKQAKQLAQFLQDNGWKSDFGIPPREDFSSLGYFITTSRFSGTLDTVRFWVVSAIPDDGGNFMKDTSSVLILEAPKDLPTLLIAPNKGMQTEILPTTAFNELGLSRLKLEGDFDTWLRLYGIKGQETETLSYVTPDVMAVFIDEVTHKVLYLGKHIYIFSELLDRLEREAYEKVFKDAQYIIKEVLEKQNH
jgi:hypothetical protein